MAAQCAMLAARLREREEELLNVRRELVEAREEVTTYRAMKEWRDEEKGRQQGGWQRERQLLNDQLELATQQHASERKHHEDELAQLAADIQTLLATIAQQHAATTQLEQHSAQQQQLNGRLQSQLLVHETNLSACTAREALLHQSIQQLTSQHTQRLAQLQSEHEAEVKSLRLESEQTERLLQAQVAAVRVALLEAQSDVDASRAKRLAQARQHERLQQDSRQRVQALEKEREAERQRLAAAEAEVEESRLKLAALHTSSAEQLEQAQQERAKLSALLADARQQLGELTSSNRQLQAELDIWQAHKEQDGKVSDAQLHVTAISPERCAASHLMAPPKRRTSLLSVLLRRSSCSFDSSTVRCSARTSSWKARGRTVRPSSPLSCSTNSNSGSSTNRRSPSSLSSSALAHSSSPHFKPSTIA